MLPCIVTAISKCCVGWQQGTQPWLLSLLPSNVFSCQLGTNRTITPQGTIFLCKLLRACGLLLKFFSLFSSLWLPWCISPSVLHYILRVSHCCTVVSSFNYFVWSSRTFHFDHSRWSSLRHDTQTPQWIRNTQYGSCLGRKNNPENVVVQWYSVSLIMKG